MLELARPLSPLSSYPSHHATSEPITHSLKQTRPHRLADALTEPGGKASLLCARFKVKGILKALPRIA
jgi:hypothetical protein